MVPLSGADVLDPGDGREKPALDRAVLDDAGRATVVEAIRRCYTRGGLRWPGRVYWVASPLQGAILATDLARGHTRMLTRFTAMITFLTRAVRSTVYGAVVYAAAVALPCCVLVLGMVGVLSPNSLPPSAGHEAGHGRGAWIGAVVGGLLMIVLFMAVFANTGREFTPPFAEGIAVIPFAGGSALVGCVLGFIVSVIVGGSAPLTQDWIAALLAWTLIPAVGFAAIVGAVMRWRWGPPVSLKYVDRAHLRLLRALQPTADGGNTGTPKRQWVSEPVDTIAITIEQVLAEMTPNGPVAYPVNHIDGRLSLTGGTDSGVQDFAGVSQAGWWWPHTEFVVIADPPTTLRLEEIGSTRQPGTPGARRLHHPGEPAAEWSDGFRLYAWRGTGVTADLIEQSTTDAISRQHDRAVRRAAIAVIGWSAYLRRARWDLLARTQDPADPTHVLGLYRDLDDLADVKVLMLTDEDPRSCAEPDRHAIPVPGWVRDPMAAAAWLYGCSADTFHQLRDARGADTAKTGTADEPTILTGPLSRGGLLIFAQQAVDLPETAWDRLPEDGIPLQPDGDCHWLRPGPQSPDILCAAPEPGDGRTLLYLRIPVGQNAGLAPPGARRPVLVGPGTYRVNAKPPSPFGLAGWPP